MSCVLITGASRGFGRELVDVYLSNGWTVFPLVRKQSDADSLSIRYPSECHPVVADVGLDSCASAIEKVLAGHTDSLDLLINNAGTIKKKRGMEGASADDMIDHFNVHVVGAWRCTRAALPFLRNATKPIIVNITSRKGSISLTARADGNLVYAYQIAKAAQNMLTACLHQELKSQKINVIAVHPGGLKTSVAPPDADTEPADAAHALYSWLETSDTGRDFACLDLMTGGTVPW